MTDRVESNDPSTIAIPPLSRIFSIVMILLGIIVVGVLFFRVMAGFFVPLFLAALLVVIFRPVHNRIAQNVGRRRWLAAMITTAMVLLIVLVPLIVLISVAASQFTSTIGNVDPQELTNRLNDARNQFGLGMVHPEKFRRLDRLASLLDAPVYAPDAYRPTPSENVTDASSGSLSDADSAAINDDDEQNLLSRIDEARTLVKYLDVELRTPQSDPDAPGIVAPDVSVPPSEPAAHVIARLDAFSEVVQSRRDQGNRSLMDRITAQEEYHSQSVVASSAIRTWMATSLGGPVRSQLRLLANPSAENFRGLLVRARHTLQPSFVSVTSRTGGYLIKFLIDFVVLIIAIYFFLVDGSKMTRTLMRLSPLDDEYEQRLVDEFDRTSRAVVLASVASAVAQGILAVIAYWFLGLPSTVLLFLLTSVLALVPFLGAASVWVPCVIYLAAVEQRYGAAIVLAIYGAGAISSIDNLIKMYVLGGRSTLHPLFALLSVLGGVSVFGPIGIVVGPMVVVFLQTLLEILNHELASDGMLANPEDAEA